MTNIQKRLPRKGDARGDTEGFLATVWELIFYKGKQDFAGFCVVGRGSAVGLQQGAAVQLGAERFARRAGRVVGCVVHLERVPAVWKELQCP